MMKKHLLTLALGLMMGSSAFAQVEFVDAQGNVIPDGSTVVRNEIETPVDIPVLGKKQQISSGISVKNTTSAAISNITTQLNTTDLPFGQLALCFPNSCWINVGDYVGTYPTHKPTQVTLSEDGPWTSPQAGSLAANETHTLQTEWYLNNLGVTTFDGQKGEFTATYSVLVNGKITSTIHVLYSTDPEASTGISGIQMGAAGKQVVGRYSLNGQKVAEDTKGLVIEKYSDGSAKKVVK